MKFDASSFYVRPFRILWFTILCVVGYIVVGWAAPILVMLASADIKIGEE